MAHTGSRPLSPLGEFIPRNPTQRPVPTPPSSSQGPVRGGNPLIGDIVSGALASVGVTQERVSSWLGEECGCKERRAKLNQLELWALRVFGFKKTAARLSEQEQTRLAEEARKDLERIAGIAKEQPK